MSPLKSTFSNAQADLSSIAYFHVLLSWRLPSLDASILDTQGVTTDQVKSDFASLLPFLTDPKSTLRYANVREAWTAIWEAIGKTLVSCTFTPRSKLTFKAYATHYRPPHPPFRKYAAIAPTLYCR